MANQIRALREGKGLSLRTLAIEVNVEASTVWRWEQGRARPLPKCRRRLARILGVTVEELGLEDQHV